MNNTYTAIGCDFDDLKIPFFFIKIGESQDVDRRMKQLRMFPLSTWKTNYLDKNTIPSMFYNYYEDMDRWLGSFLDQELEIFARNRVGRTYKNGAKKFGGYTECYGRFNTHNEALNFEAELQTFAERKIENELAKRERNASYTQWSLDTLEDYGWNPPLEKRREYYRDKPLTSTS